LPLRAKTNDKARKNSDIYRLEISNRGPRGNIGYLPFSDTSRHEYRSVFVTYSIPRETE